MLRLTTLSDGYLEVIMVAPHNPIQNKLLAALPVSEFKRLSPHLELVPMPLGDSYHESGGMLQHVYFPTTSIVSLQYVTENGAPAEIACVGNEGMLGIPLFIEGNATLNRATVRTVGYGYKLKMRILIEEFNRNKSMRHLLLRYTQALITQTTQIAECNQHHSVDQRLCRWLLLILDRMSSNELIFTQEWIARMFGLGVESVMEAVRKLQQAGFIYYGRDRITVLNRSGLEEHACECYNVVKMEFDRFLGLDWDWRPMPESVNTWSRASMSICAQM
jgi:CRP-like cAMP-binding protein